MFLTSNVVWFKKDKLGFLKLRFTCIVVVVVEGKSLLVNIVCLFILGLITKPRNQMSCGSCSAFAAIATVETCMRRSGTPLKDLDLSEQQIVDCGYNGKDMNGCNGAQLGAYQKFLAFSGKNVSHEVQYPYLDRDPNLECMGKLTWNTGAKVTRAITDYGCNEDKLKKLGKYSEDVKALKMNILSIKLN